MARIKTCPKCLNKDEICLTFITAVLAHQRAVLVQRSNGEFELDVQELEFDISEVSPYSLVKCDCGHITQVQNLFEVEDCDEPKDS